MTRHSLTAEPRPSTTTGSPRSKVWRTLPLSFRPANARVAAPRRQPAGVDGPEHAQGRSRTDWRAPQRRSVPPGRPLGRYRTRISAPAPRTSGAITSFNPRLSRVVKHDADCRIKCWLAVDKEPREPPQARSPARASQAVPPRAEGPSPPADGGRGQWRSRRPHPMRTPSAVRRRRGRT